MNTWTSFILSHVRQTPRRWLRCPALRVSPPPAMRLRAGSQAPRALHARTALPSCFPYCMQGSRACGSRAPPSVAPAAPPARENRSRAGHPLLWSRAIAHAAAAGRSARGHHAPSEVRVQQLLELVVQHEHERACTAHARLTEAVWHTACSSRRLCHTAFNHAWPSNHI